MPMTVNGSSGITFPDSTVQATAASVSTALNTVGTYCLAATTSGVAITAGSTFAGSSLAYGGFYSTAVMSGTAGYNIYWQGGGGTPSGTWRAMGIGTYPPAATYPGATLFVRIS